MSRPLFLIIITCMFCAKGYAQDTTNLASLICRFKVPRSDGTGSGTGFIVAQRQDTLYLVTAGHVLKNYAADKPISVLLGNSTDTLKAVLQFRHHPDYGDKEDLAVCTVVTKNYQYPKISVIDSLLGTIPLFYYENDSLRMVDENRNQFLVKRSHATHTYRITMPQVEGGDSGGPVFTMQQIPQLAGIILGGDQICEVLRIAYIIDVIKKQLPNLTHNLNFYNEIVQNTPTTTAIH